LALVFLVFAIYVYVNYPRTAEPFEIKTDDPSKKILIVTQSSEFKDALVGTLCDSLKKSPLYIRGIDVGDIERVNDNDWDRILIINTFMIHLNKKIDQFIKQVVKPENILLLVTSGGADWQPKPELEINALTSASRKEYIKGLVNIITDWLGKNDNIKWEPNDYLLALKYFPRVDVNSACRQISLEQKQYKILYSNLVNLINEVGYLYLRRENVHSALEIFKLNVNLFSDFWNVYDSYGEALLKKGNREAAIKNYQKALELNPESKSTKEMLKKLIPE